MGISYPVLSLQAIIISSLSGFIVGIVYFNPSVLTLVNKEIQRKLSRAERSERTGAADKHVKRCSAQAAAPHATA